MDNLTQPTLLLKPFAESGDKNMLPVTNTDASNPQLADLTNGFPQVTSEDPDDGGLPPERKDFNGLGYLTTTYDYFYQAGGTFTFNPTISSAIGGYPLGARLWYTDSNGVSCILRSTIDNNTNNFLSDQSVIGTLGSGKPWVIESFRGIGLNEQYVSNCITEIPQDINIELSSGTLTLKAGSKVYFPNGSGTFEVFTLPNNYGSGDVSGITYDYMFFINNSKTGIVGSPIGNIYSGTTAPVNPVDGTIWYDTTNYSVKRWSGSAWIGGFSFPVAILSEGTVLKQIFNGFGYIGSTAFILPGVKGLIPNGRNVDGTLNNTVFSISSVKQKTFENTYTYIGIKYWVDSYGSFGGTNAAINYHEDINKVLYDADFTQRLYCDAGIISMVNGRITSFRPKTSFHAVDYSSLFNGNNTFSGNNSHTGEERFKNSPYNLIIQNVVMDNSANPSSNVYEGIEVRDKNDVRIGWFGISKDTNGMQTWHWQEQGNTTGIIATSGIMKSINNWGMPNYNGITSYTPNSAAPSNGFVFIAANGYDYFPSISVNGVTIIATGGGNYNCTTSTVIPVRTGDKVTHAGTLVSAYFVPCVGG